LPSQRDLIKRYFENNREDSYGDSLKTYFGRFFNVKFNDNLDKSSGDTILNSGNQ
jgi:ABC-type transporter MlaC component